MGSAEQRWSFRNNNYHGKQEQNRNMNMTRRMAEITVLATFILTGCAGTVSPPQTGLEKTNYQQLTSSEEMLDFLEDLDSQEKTAERIIIGTSANGNHLAALLISKDIDRFRQGYAATNTMTVLLIGAQHGMEPSGAEALLLLARDIVNGSLSHYLNDMNFIIIPNSNPDGRNANRRVNGHGVNLSTDFTLLSQPETRAIMGILHRWKPDLVLDIHESALLKKKTLAKEGYLTDFEAQFEGPTNPNVDSRIQTFSCERLLPDIIAQVNARGLPARRYIGEITSTSQVITHGGVSLRNVRNMAGMLGSFSFLLENRLDPSTGSYPTPRNIQVRVQKQYLCISGFLERCRGYQNDITAITQAVRESWKKPENEEMLYFAFTYVPDTMKEEITLPLRKLDTGQPVECTFPYFGAIAGDAPLMLPESYIITTHQKALAGFLTRHQIAYQIVDRPVEINVGIQRVLKISPAADFSDKGRIEYQTLERTVQYTLRPGDMIVFRDQPARRLIPLLLEIQSGASIFATPEYAPLVKTGEDFFIFRGNSMG